MENRNVNKVKALGWISSSKKDLMDFPLDVRKEMGHALYIAQRRTKIQGMAA